tara:strand:+ start:219 stop:1100 length:882 start_codon:yes stop_codon:yes gene_type:complete
MTEVIKHTDFDVSKITGTKPSARGGKKDKLTAYLLYDNSPFLLKLPALKAPFGVTSYNNNGTSSNNYSLNLSAKAMLSKDVDKQEELNQQVEDIYNQLEQLDKFMISYGLEYSKSIFGKEYEVGKHDAVVEALFTSTVKSSEDKDGNPYPRRMNTKIRSQYEQPDKPNVKVYKGSREDLNDDDFTFDSFEDLVQKGTFVEAVIQPGLWFISGKFGVTWRIIQMKVHEMKPIGPPTESVFSDDEDDDNNNTTDDKEEKNDAKSEESENEEAEDSDDDDDEEDDESDEEEEVNEV